MLVTLRGVARITILGEEAAPPMVDFVGGGGGKAEVASPYGTPYIKEKLLVPKHLEWTIAPLTPFPPRYAPDWP